jgi:hypothetical protein
MKKFVLLAIICCSLLIPSKIWAQGPMDPPCDGADPWEECPIDADIGFLIAGGLAIGWFAIKKNLVKV